MIVVDLGCATYPGFPADESTNALIERFKPSVYYGFDPHPSVIERDRWIANTRTIIERKAAWTYDGTIGFVTVPEVLNDLRSHVDPGDPNDPVPCFDLANFLFATERYAQGALVLKLDVEGAEYTLLRYLVSRGADRLLNCLLVEWHGPPLLDLPLACPAEPW